MNTGRAAVLALIACRVLEGGLTAATPEVKLDLWYTTGSLKAQAFGDALFPEKGVELSAKSPAGEPLWTPCPQWRDGPVMARRMAMHARYANRTDDPEQILDTGSKEPVKFVAPAPMPERKPQDIRAAGWPFDAAEAAKQQTAANLPARLKIDLKESASLDLALIPAGEFVMGDPDLP